MASNKYTSNYYANDLVSCTTYLLETYGGVEYHHLPWRENFNTLFDKVMSLQQFGPAILESEGWMEWARQIVWVAQRALGFAY